MRPVAQERIQPDITNLIKKHDYQRENVGMREVHGRKVRKDGDYSNQNALSTFMKLSNNDFNQNYKNRRMLVILTYLISTFIMDP